MSAALLLLSGAVAGTGAVDLGGVGWVLVLALVSGFYSGNETALVSAHRLRLEAMAAQGRSDARTALRLLDHAPRAIATMLVGTNLATVGASSLTTALFTGISPEHGVAYATLCITPLLLFVGEILPKALFRSHATALFRIFAPALRASEVVLSPLVHLASGATRFVLWVLRTPAAERRPLFRREDLAHVLLHAITAEHADARWAVGSTFRMARKALDLKNLRVRDAMVPLPDDWTVPAAITVGEAVDRLRQVRSPFLATLDETGKVRGFVLAKSLLALTPERPLDELVRPAYVLNPEDQLDNAVGAFRRSQQSVGLVRDRGGATLGVLTAEDILEEIVGELEAGPEERN
ncbi:CNNM domain-containing protein [bacterium]|nr:CNNM domain-containing protein [bacterium]